MNIHRDNKLDNLIGKAVAVTFFNDREITGVLGFAADFSEKYQYRKPNYYFIDNYGFRKSHVKKIREL